MVRLKSVSRFALLQEPLAHFSKRFLQIESKGGIMKSLPCVLTAILVLATPAFATVTVTSPTAGVTTTSPVHYVASATSSTCAAGVASMGVYVDNVKVYVVNATSINTAMQQMFATALAASARLTQ